MLKAILDTLAVFFVRLLIGLLRFLPWPAALVLARGLVEVLLQLMGRARAVGRKNLQIAFPERTVAEREEILRRSFWVLADNLVGFARIPSLSKSRAARLVDFSPGAALLDRLRLERPGAGLVIATMHFGPFETLVQLHQILYGDIWMLARGFNLPKLDSWWNARRGTFGARVYARAGAYREMIRRLNEGQVITLLCDQNVKINHATFANFFGIPAATTKSVGLAALRTGAPVIMATSRHRPSGDYELLFEQLPHPDSFPGTSEEKVQKFTEELNASMERYIRLHPEQWFWIHRRWKTRPPGEEQSIY